MIIDGDGHFVEPLSAWTDFMDPRFAGRLSVTTDARGLARVVSADGFDVFDRGDGNTSSRWGIGNFFTPGGLKPGRPENLPFEAADPGGWDGRARLQVHDDNGIDAAVMFPT